MSHVVFPCSKSWGHQDLKADRGVLPMPPPHTLADSIDRLVQNFVRLKHPEVSCHPTSRSWAPYAGGAMALCMFWGIQCSEATRRRILMASARGSGTGRQALPAPRG